VCEGATSPGTSHKKSPRFLEGLFAGLDQSIKQSTPNTQTTCFKSLLFLFHVYPWPVLFCLVYDHVYRVYHFALTFTLGWFRSGYAHPFSCGVVLGAGGEENDDGEDNESEECFCQKNLFHYCLFVKANIRESFKREKWNPTKKPWSVFKV